MSIVYAKNLLTLDTAIIIAKNVERELVMANKNKQFYILEDQIA